MILQLEPVQTQQFSENMVSIFAIIAVKNASLAIKLIILEYLLANTDWRNKTMRFEQHFPYEYVQGYTAALQDVIKTIEDIQIDLKMHKYKQSKKTYLGILKCMLKNRCVLRENTDAFVRCNKEADDLFEVYFDNR